LSGRLPKAAAATAVVEAVVVVVVVVVVQAAFVERVVVVESRGLLVSKVESESPSPGAPYPAGSSGSGH
jgi:hypothetical protein